eukprot:6064475-Amphidinium_carterae.1
MGAFGVSQQHNARDIGNVVMFANDVVRLCIRVSRHCWQLLEAVASEDKAGESDELPLTRVRSMITEILPPPWIKKESSCGHGSYWKKDARAHKDRTQPDVNCAPC